MSDDAIFPGTDRFVVRGRLGHGGMGMVYRVWDAELDREVALKTVHRPGAEGALRLRREFRARVGVTHPNLLQLYELFVDKDLCFFTMELIEGDDFLYWARERLGFTRGHAPPASVTPGASGTTLGVTWLADPVEHPSSPVSAEAGALSQVASPAVIPGARVPPSEEAWTRLRRGVADLVEGLHALHIRGRVHRDVKPMNVLVAPGDRVVLLDFGLLTEMDKEGDIHLRSREIAGTPAYMAPEQILARPLTGATDLYAIGVILYEVLAGVLPFSGDVETIFDDKVRLMPLSARVLAADAPADLADLAMDLLAVDPARRPTADECLARLLPAEAPSVSRPTGWQVARFVGRSSEMDVLTAALEDVVERRLQVTVHIHGPSGIGKSTLVRAFLEAQRHASAPLVLAGRCHPQESVPYKALHAAIDGLAQHLSALPDGLALALLPSRAYALLHLFPVLTKITALRNAPAPAVLPDAVDLRQQGFGALRDLFARMTALRPLVIWIDDVQWGDMDSAPLLDELVRVAAPSFLLLLSYRTDDRSRSPLLRHILRGGESPEVAAPPVRELALGALGAEEVAELARAFLDAAEPGLKAQIDTIITQCEGNPFIACEMARYVAAHAAHGDGAGLARMDIARIVMERIRALDPARRRILEIAAVAGKPIERGIALAAAGLSEWARPLCAELCDANLLRDVAGERGRVIAPYHDRIREVLLAAIPPDEQRQRHRDLAEALTACGSTDLEALLHHWEGAGERRRAGEYAVRAADRAAAARAFDNAAAFYEKSLALGYAGAGPERARLLEKLGDALAHRGRAPEAARRYLEAAVAAGGDAGALRTRAAEHYIKGGAVDEGWREMRRVLVALRVPIPGSFLGAVGAASWQRLRFLLRRTDARRMTFPAAPPANERPLLDALWAASTSMIMLSPHLADAFRMIHLGRALKVGDASTVCRALAYEAAMETHLGGAFLDRSVEDLLEQVAHLAARTRDPYDAAWYELANANVAFTHAAWRRTAEACRRADTIFREQCPGSAWERVTVAIFHHCALAMRGELRELLTRLTELAEDARLRGDTHALCEAFVGEPMLAWLAADLGDEARAQAEAALARQASRSRRWPERGYRRQQYADMLAFNYAAHYRGDPWPAWANVLRHWPYLRRSFLLPLRCTGLELRWARARAALAAAAAPRPAGAWWPWTSLRQWKKSALIEDVQRQLRWIEGDPLQLGVPVGCLLRAAMARVEGRDDEAAPLLTRAISGFDALEMMLHREAARVALGEILGGTTGAALQREGEAWMVGQGVVRPRALVAAVAPGLVSPASR